MLPVCGGTEAFAAFGDEPHVVGLTGAMAQTKSACDAYTENFNHPDRQWAALATRLATPRSSPSTAPAARPPRCDAPDARSRHPRRPRCTVLYPPPADREAFRGYYGETHLPLAAKLPGLRGYRYGFALSAPPGESPYWCIFEADFDDAAAMGAAMTSEQGQKVAADVPNYAPDGAVMFSFDVVGGH